MRSSIKSRKKQAAIKEELHREQYCGLSHFHDGVYQAWFTTIVKTIGDPLCRLMASNIFKESQLIVTGAKEGICSEIEKGHTEIPGVVEKS